ncbi:MAG: bifunctional phosphoglucose/phosphomannose isomerase, glucose/mannose-6-phosphate isomerase [Parcubacteria group bacterium]|nr:bifunctional phosphoglucose/phosphomannose isomerase, glucose/mannose-6-phosphate isomerase [Parcubacteria group bacterium]
MIEELPQQLVFAPLVSQPLATVPERIVIGGMGGSALAGESFAYLAPARDVMVHREYGLPTFGGSDALCIAISYSGNTEETVSFANAAMRQGLPLAVVTSGGTLAGFAQREGLPLVLVPAGLQPRAALIYMVRALLALAQIPAPLEALARLTLDLPLLAEEAEQDAHFMLPSVPLFYSSDRNALLARIGKIMMNETGKMPAFMNTFSELNHNEMQAFDTTIPEGLEHLFRFVIVKDSEDEPRITRRMDAFRSLMEERGRSVRVLDISGMSREEALVTVLARFTIAARFLAQTRGIDPDAVPLIEAFKKML